MPSRTSNASRKPTTEAGAAVKKGTVELAAELDRLRVDVAVLQAEVERLSHRHVLSEEELVEVRSASARAKQFLNDQAVARATARAADIGQLYDQAYTMLATVEMVIHTLWRTKRLQAHLSVGDAATRLVQLMGHGPEYFQARRHWSIESWIDHLIHLKPSELPSGVVAAPPRSDEVF